MIMKYLKLFENFTETKTMNEMKSYQETQGKLKEFTEGLKSHLEQNGYTVLDNPDKGFDKPLIGNKKNIIFSYDVEMLFVYYENDNDEAFSTIVDYFNSSNLGIKGGAGLRGAHTSFIKFK